MTENLICNTRSTPAGCCQSSPPFTHERTVIPYMTFDNLWRKKSFLIMFVSNWTDRNRTMSSYSVGVDQSRSMSHVVQWWEVYGMGAETWTLHLPTMCLLCHWQMKRLWGRRWTEGLTVTPSRKSECVRTWQCVSVCVKKKLRFLSRWLGSILAFPSSCPIQALGHKSSSLLLININIILYYPLPLNFSTA